MSEQNEGGVAVMEPQQTAVAAAPRQSLQRSASGGLQLSTFDEMWRFAKAVSASGLAPKGMDAPEQILIALEMGYEVGLPPMQAVQSIAVINGRPSVWGDAAMGLVRNSGLLAEYRQEEFGKKYDDTYGWQVTSLRVGSNEPIVTRFTVADARKAGLWGKGGPWSANPDRMILNRCRAFNLRDNFQDVLRGLTTREEARDIQEAEFEVMNAPAKSKTESLLDKLGAAPAAVLPAPAPPVGIIEPAKEPEPVTKPASAPVEPSSPPQAATPAPKEEAAPEPPRRTQNTARRNAPADPPPLPEEEDELQKQLGF